MLTTFVKSFVFKCIKMENSLKHVWECRAESFTIDDDETEVQLVSDNITKRDHEMAQIQGSEFPAAAIALKVCLHPYPYL